jgi:hypothetical protein
MAKAQTATPLRLRFDKVATRLVERVSRNVRDSVPAGTTAIFSVTAPIRLPSETTVAIAERIRSALARRSLPLEFEEKVHGNEVRIWLVSSTTKRPPEVIGLVHNPGARPDELLAAARARIRGTV